MLERLFRPRAVAVIGASANPLSIGHKVMQNLIAHGFTGPIYPINPKEKSIAQLPVFSAVREIPGPVDLVNIAIPKRHLPQVIEECGQHGVAFAIIHTAGYKETGSTGAQQEAELVALARRWGVRLFGPNCQGVQNSDPAISLYASFTFVPMMPGSISILAQGGGLGEMLKLHLYRGGLGHRLYAAYGNESDVSLPELLAYCGQDPGTQVIMVQVESFNDPRAFLEVARTITPRRPILTLKAGRTAAGMKAVASHTGSLLDQAALAQAIFQEAGVLAFQDTDEMIKAAIALSNQPLPRGRRLGIITNTGSPGVLAVDEAMEQQLSLASWSEAGARRLSEQLLPEASIANPVDVVATAGPEHYAAALQTLLAEEETDLVLLFFVTAPFVDRQAIVQQICQTTRGAKKPVVVVIETLEANAELIKTLRQAGLPVYEFPEDGVRALAALARYATLRTWQIEAVEDFCPPPSLDRETAVAIHHRAVEKRPGHPSFYLSQEEAFALLAAYGINTPRVATIGGEAPRIGQPMAQQEIELAEVARRVGFPCVLKIDSPQVLHKSAQQGVVLSIQSLDALRRALRDLSARFADLPGAFVVMEHLPPGVELALGASTAPGLGKLVLFGLGGRWVEEIRDVAFAVAPLNQIKARRAMQQIKAQAVLHDSMLHPGLDREALAQMMVRLAQLAVDLPAIEEMDLNPVLAYPAGTPPIVVDVRIKMRGYEP